MGHDSEFVCLIRPLLGSCVYDSFDRILSIEVKRHARESTHWLTPSIADVRAYEELQDAHGEGRIMVASK